MDTLTFHVGAEGAEEMREVLEIFLNALAQTNALYYKRYPKGPCCPGCAGLKYREPDDADKPGEEFFGIEALYVEGAGSCKDLAPMVAGHELAHGRDARVSVELQSSPTSPQREYHVVLYVDGERRDPSAVLIERGLTVGREPASPLEPVVSAPIPGVASSSRSGPVVLMDYMGGEVSPSSNVASESLASGPVCDCGGRS